MSRIPDCDYGDDGPDTSGLWLHAQRRALASPHGQARLREIERALLALPDKRLLDGSLGDGEWCCTVGALRAYREMRAGATWEEALEVVRDDSYAIDCIWDMEEYGVGLGLRKTMVWALVEQNDEVCAAMSPEERWAYMVDWVRQQLRPSEATAVAEGAAG